MEKHLPQIGSVYRSLGKRSSWERLGCGVMDKRHNIADHAHYMPPSYSVIWIIEGSGVYCDEMGKPIPFQAGDCFHRLPGRSHSTQPSSKGGWIEWFVDCGPSLYNAFVGLGLLHPEPAVWHAGSIPHDQLEKLRTALEQAPARDLPLLTSQVLMIISRARRGVQADALSDEIDQACVYLAEASQGRLDLRSWCHQHGHNYEHFRKAFVQRMGEPPGQYRIRRRMERACALLMAGDLSITQVAEELGYASPYEFSAQFRRRFDMSPKAYRIMNRS